MAARTLIDARLGPFRVERLLGEGAMSEVYAAIDDRLDRPVALKVLHRHLARSAEVRTRFATEARLASRLNHPHVIPIYETGELDGLLYIAMHRVDGHDLGRLLESSSPLSPVRAARLIGQAAKALDVAHSSGLMHRDVKPANILVARQERGREHVFLTDFGLTKVIGSASRHTQTGQIVGTVHYMSPEQIEGLEVTHLTDVYALGCVLFECLTGKPPFERDSDLAVLWAHVHTRIPKVTDHREISPSVDAVIERALAKFPEDRYETAGAMARDFRLALRRRHLPPPRARGISSASLSRGGISTEPRASSLRRRATSAVGGLVMLSLLMGSVLVVGRATGVWRSPLSSGDIYGSRLGQGSTETAPSLHRGPGRQQGQSTEKRSPQESFRTGSFTRGATGRTSEGARDVPSDLLPEEGRLNPLDGTGKRTVTAAYSAAAIDGYGDECVGGNLGCVEFTAQPGERFVWISMDDSSGGIVRAWVKRDLDADGAVDGEWALVCGQLDQPLRVVPGTIVRVVLQRGKCGALESTPTTGKVTAVFSRGPQE